MLLSLLPHGSIVFLELLDLILAHITSKIGTLWLLKGTVVVGRVASGQLRLKEAVHSVSIMFWSLASLSPPPPRCKKRSDVSDVSDSALDKARRAVMNVEMKYLFMFEV